MSSLPRYFVARSGGEDELPSPPAPIMQFIDSFIVGGRHFAEMDCAVGVDALGDLQLYSMSRARQLDQDLQAQLTFSELSAGAGRRLLSLSRFYMFALQLLEQPGDSPGLNDPVYLYGKLYGTFPEAPNTVAIEGQLTVTRADILNGIAEGEKHSFTYAAGTNHSTLPTRCLHLMVPADNDSELQRGAGVVLVYPLPTAELAAADPSNELTIKQIVFDTVQALKKDIDKNKVRSKLSKVDLPVPSRRALEMDLESRGYLIKGNMAVRKLPVSGPFDGILESIYGKITGDKLELPPEGSLKDFIDIAALAMQSVSGWPPERCKALNRLCRRASAEEIARACQSVEAAAPVRQIKTPKTSSAAEPQKQAARTEARQSSPASQGPPSWMRDFMSNHKAAGKATITPSTSQETVSKRKEQTGKTSNWMNDFNAPEDEIKQHKTKPEKNDSKPDWMSDFQ